jgi:threonine dehydratase
MEKFKNLFSQIQTAEKNLQNVISKTPLVFSPRLSKKYNCEVWLKREDLQVVRSYKIRGAYNLMCQLSPVQKKQGVVCASAGNHAQGVALACAKLKTKGVIFMPTQTPKQKIDRVLYFGGKWIKLELCGETFDETSQLAQAYCKKHSSVFVHPFDNEKIIAGQGTVGLEILEQLPKAPNFVIAPIGGGGLCSGLGIYLKTLLPDLKLIGTEPAGASCMNHAFNLGKPEALEKIDKFIDGAAVKKAGELTYKICKQTVNKLLQIPEGKVCTEMIALYQQDGIIAEPAGALAVASLDSIKDEIKNKVVVCIISGGNNDMSRYAEVTERSLVYLGLKHYFLINFSQKPGALRKYLDQALGKNDDITLFEYTKKNNRENGPALIGVELQNKNDYQPLLNRMKKIGLDFEVINSGSVLYKFLI